MLRIFSRKFTAPTIVVALLIALLMLMVLFGPVAFMLSFTRNDLAFVHYNHYLGAVYLRRSYTNYAYGCDRIQWVFGDVGIEIAHCPW